MGYKIKVSSSASAGNVMVPHLGSFEPNVWTELTDKAVARFESVKGPIEESGLEVKKTSPPKKKESE